MHLKRIMFADAPRAEISTAQEGEMALSVWACGYILTRAVCTAQHSKALTT